MGMGETHSLDDIVGGSFVDKNGGENTVLLLDLVEVRPAGIRVHVLGFRILCHTGFPQASARFLSCY